MHDEHRDRHIIGPILLILAGVGLLLEQLGMLTIQWGSLWQYWPVLLILLGLDILLGRTRLGGLLVLVVTIAAVAIILIGTPIPWIEPRSELTSETFSYPLEAIEEAEVRLSPGVGRVNISSLKRNANVFAEVEIESADDTSILTTDMHRENEYAELRIESEKSTWGPSNDHQGDRWTIDLHPEPLLALYLDGGVGVSEYDLADLNLERLDVNVGIGEVKITLPDEGLYDVDIDGGIGRVTVYVPDHLPVQIDVDGGIGRDEISDNFRQVGNLYVTDSWDRNEDAIEIDIDGGIGTVSVR